VARRHQQPRQRGTVDEPHRAPATPRLEKRDRDDVIGVVPVLNETVRVPGDAILVPIEHAPEGLAIAGHGSGPVGSLRFPLHTK
jgi:hypothetical protein